MMPASCKKGGLLGGNRCGNMIDLIFGNSKHLNSSRLPVYLSISPSTASTKTIEHFAQMLQSGNFSAYNYSTAKKNLKHYNSSTPPEYSLADLSVPTALFSGSEDKMSDPADVIRLRSEVRPGVVFEDMEIPEYSHVDFLWAQDANKLLYPHVVKAITTHAPEKGIV